MNEKIKILIARIDALSIRERGLLLLAIVFVLYSVWNGLFMGPLTAHHKQVQTQLKQLQTTISTLSEQSATITKRQTQDPDTETRAKVASVQAEIDTLDAHINTRIQGLIDPTAMAKMMEDVLKSERGLKLISVKSLPARPLLDTEVHEDGKTGQANAGVPGIYRHGMTLTFEGGYLDALHYFHTLESLPWRLYWDSMAFQVLKYPTAQFTITVHTIGLREGWIGV